jgi:glycosyltransferase involved in cell wall biosynthesis
VSEQQRADAMAQPSICFVAHNAFASLTGSNDQHAGGIERQQATMAVWLAKRGWRVSLVCWGDSVAGDEWVSGVRVVPMCQRRSGVPGLRFFYPRWTSLNASLASANASLYYYNCGDLSLGQIVMWAKRRCRSVVFSVPSDPDCDPALPALKSKREKVLYRYGLGNTEHIIVQTNRQAKMLQNGFAKSSTVLAMPCRGFQSVRKSQNRERLQVLWVGRLSVEKRPDWIIEAAARMPDLDFTVVGDANKETPYALSVREQAARLPNLSLVGRVPYEQMGDYFSRADLLCCTSVYEGFPNAFLEAWSVSLPVITTCDPDGIVTSRSFGFHVSSVDELVQSIGKLCDDYQMRITMGSEAMRYFTQNHTLDSAMEKFDDYFRAVLAKHRTAQA